MTAYNETEDTSIDEPVKRKRGRPKKSEIAVPKNRKRGRTMVSNR